MNQTQKAKKPDERSAAQKIEDFGKGVQKAGQEIMKFGCLLMLVGLIGLVFIAVIF